MLKRPELHSKWIQAQVPVNPALSLKAQCEQWLESLRGGPCERHPKNLMRLDRNASLRHSFNHETPQQLFYFKEGLKAGYCCFTAIYNCPVCRLEHALVPPEFYDSSFEDFETKTPELEANLNRCRAYVEQVNTQRCGFLLMVGVNGTGKTRLACNILRELNDNDWLYLRQGTFTLEHRRSYGKDRNVFHHFRRGRREDYDDEDDEEEEEEKTVAKLAQGVKVLVLDEIGCQALAADETLLLDEVIKHRFDKRMPTILVSNLPLEGAEGRLGLKQFLGNALWDRVCCATGNGKFVLQFSQSSYRRQVGEAYLHGL